MGRQTSFPISRLAMRSRWEISEASGLQARNEWNERLIALNAQRNSAPVVPRTYAMLTTTYFTKTTTPQPAMIPGQARSRCRLVGLTSHSLFFLPNIIFLIFQAESVKNVDSARYFWVRARIASNGCVVSVCFPCFYDKGEMGLRLLGTVRFSRILCEPSSC